MTKAFIAPVLCCLLCGLTAAQPERLQIWGSRLTRDQSIQPGKSATASPGGTITVEDGFEIRGGSLSLIFPASKPSLEKKATVRMTALPSYRNGVVTLPAGVRSVELYTLSGKKAWRHSRAENTRTESVKVPEQVSRQPLKLRFKAE